MSGKNLELLDGIHVLDLAEDGEIKPHTDSVKVGNVVLVETERERVVTYCE